ncbi:MAG TPA: pyridoxal-dependent decarboxylase, partial [Candidatus Brocadiia bacterium]|nr:pyridoxal-dependent decarboxylase [Candidatus Brocadiia bacterium]
MMRIKVERRGGRTVVICAGRLDAESAPGLEEAVKPLLGGESGPVALDFSAVDYLSSAGIRALLFLFKEAGRTAGKARGGAAPLRLASLSERAEETLRLAGMLEMAGPGSCGAAPAAGHTGQHWSAVMDKVRRLFPAPVSDAARDREFVDAIAMGLERIDALKTRRPYLGIRAPLDYEQAQAAATPERMVRAEDAITEAAEYLNGMVIWGHPHTMENVGPPPSIPSIAGNLFCSIYNPNLVSDETSQRLSLAEVEVSAMCGRLIGYDPKVSTGVFTYGGSGTILYGVKLGVEKAQAGAFRKGLNGPMKLVCSDVAHSASITAAGWLGLGADSVVTVATDSDNSMGLQELEDTLRRLLENGERVAYIVATMGSTDAFGVDNVGFIVRLRDRLAAEYHLDYKPHVHADAAIGWAWSVFNDYDFDGNPMKFSERT